MNSTTSTIPSNKTKLELNIIDAESSTVVKINKSSNSDNQLQTKNSSNQKLNINDDKKQCVSVNSNNSNVGTLNSPTRSKNGNRKQPAYTKGKKRRATFSKNYLDVVYVESFKRYNVDMSMNGSEQNEVVRCRCSIF